MSENGEYEARLYIADEEEPPPKEVWSAYLGPAVIFQKARGGGSCVVRHPSSRYDLGGWLR
jgi:hypothetical protein